jgi:hypothetical protein
MDPNLFIYFIYLCLLPLLYFLFPRIY